MFLMEEISESGWSHFEPVGAMLVTRWFVVPTCPDRFCSN